MRKISGGILVVVVTVALLVIGGSVTMAQGPTSTFVPSTPTPEGNAIPTFIPSAPQAALSLTVTETYRGTITAGRWEIFEFVGQAEQQVTIRLRSSNFDPYLELYSPTDYRTPFLTDDDSGRGRNATLYNITLPIDGVYRVLARSYQDEGAGQYIFSIEDGAGYIPPADQRQTMAYGQVLDGTLTTEADYYAFEGTGGDVVSALLSSTAFDAYLELADANGVILAENDDNGRAGDKDAAVTNIELPADGLYFLIVASFNLNATGTYTLELINVNDTTLPTGGVLQLNQTQHARLLPDVQVEWTFEATTGQVISVGAMAMNAQDGFDLIFELVPPSGGGLLNDDGGYGRNPAITDYHITQDGTYTVRLREYNASIGGLYDMMLYEGRRYFSPSGTPSIHLTLDSDDGTIIIDELENPTQRFRLYTITVPANRLLAADLLTGNGGTGLPQDFRVQVYDSTWELVSEATSGVVTDLVAVQTDYLLLLEYRGPARQAYQLTVATLSQPPQRLDLPILGTLTVAEPFESVLAVGTRHARLFIAPSDGAYRFMLNKLDAADNYDPYLYVLDMTGGVLAEDDDSAGGFDPRATVNLQAGDQVVVVVASFADASAGPYRITVSQE